MKKAFPKAKPQQDTPVLSKDFVKTSTDTASSCAVGAIKDLSSNCELHGNNPVRMIKMIEIIEIIKIGSHMENELKQAKK